ncbi:N-acetyltransferase [Stagnimonas aquatica]|uniref:N-acetyltransferase n=1 Tax=Stagnimonas aquatica TaxID=2689987 RepID=A0A3N0VEG6_9GAMM|nr:GNAT family N-acetyltransferase [Stagnimonas aquatica]ROH91054.1 N-acetyltransferase [Stagnimonas aquatica]
MGFDAGRDGLRSARLQLRRFELADLPLLQRLNSDPEVMRYLGGPEAPEDTRTMLEGRILSYYQEQPGLGVWASIERHSGACIGFHLLNHIRGESLIQVGYRLFPQYWGSGYATEMSVALLRYGYTQLGLPSLCAITHPDNAGSQRVLLKSGLERQGERAFSHPSYAPYGAMPFFQRGAEDWLRTAPGG